MEEKYKCDKCGKPITGKVLIDGGYYPKCENCGIVYDHPTDTKEVYA